MTLLVMLRNGIMEGEIATADYDEEQGTNECEFNVTYNYSPYYHLFVQHGLLALNGMTGSESVPVLKKLVQNIDTLTGIEWEDLDVISQEKLISKIASENIKRNLQIKASDRYKQTDYFEATPDNAVKPIRKMLNWAEKNPDAKWSIG